MREGKCLRSTFPVYHPIRSRPPSISVYEEREVSVVEKKLPIQPFDRDRDDIFPSDEVERSICMIEKRLGLKSL